MSYQSAKDWQDSQPGTQTTHEKAQHTPDSYKASRYEALCEQIAEECCQVAELTAQRDALLEALQSLTQLIRNGVDLYGAKQLEWLTQKNSFARAERAIAQATGNSQ